MLQARTITRAAKRTATNAPAVEARFGTRPNLAAREKLNAATTRQGEQIAEVTRARAASDDVHELAKRALREIEDLRARCDAQDLVIAALLARDDPPIEKDGGPLGRWRPLKWLAVELSVKEGTIRYWRDQGYIQTEVRSGGRVWVDTETLKSLPENIRRRLTQRGSSLLKDGDFANLRIELQRETAHASPHGTRPNQIASSRRPGR